MTGAASYWCERALVDGVVRSAVRVGVVDGRFASVEPDVAASADDRRLRGLTIPGLANAHSHAFHRALRSRTQRDGGTFWTWRETMYRAAAQLEPDSYHRLARATFAEMVLAGITCVGEFHYLHHRPDGGRYDDPNEMGTAVLAAAAEAGLRITLLDTVYLHGGLDESGFAPLSGSQIRFGDGDAEAWAARVDDLAAADGRRIGAAVHSVRAVDPGAIRLVAMWASEHAAPLHAHVSEQIAENERCRAAFGATPTEWLAEAGAIGPEFTAVHATHLTGGDVELLAGSTVCMCPTTERDLGDGIGPSRALVEAGAALAVGSDSHAVIDLFEEARAIELDERLRSRRRGCHRTPTLVAAATVGGHRSLGWDDAGAIAVGRRADLVAVRTDTVRTAGVDVGSALDALVFAATAGDVTDVVVDGRHVVVDGRHAAIDVERELTESITVLMDDQD